MLIHSNSPHYGMLTSYLCCCLLSLSYAYSAPLQLSPVVVTEKRRVPPKNEPVALSHTMVTEEEISEKQTDYLVDLLNTVPGIYVLQSGGKGHLTSVFIRGTNNHVQVRIDGMRANNPGAADGSFDFGNFTALGLSSIDVQRGPISSLYGPDAIGGVIHLKTAQGKGKPSIQGMIEGGSFGTYRIETGVQGEVDKTNVNLSVSRHHSKGTVVVPRRLWGQSHPEKTDPYEQIHLNGRFGITLSDTLSLSLFSRMIHSQLGYHMGLFAQRQQTKQYLNRLQINKKNTEETWIHEGALSYLHLEQIDAPHLRPESKNYSKGERLQLDYDLTYKQSPLLEWRFHVNGERENMILYNPSIPRTQASLQTSGVSVFPKWRPFSWLLIETGLRADYCTRYKIPATYRLATEIYPLKNLTLTAQFGTAYKTPTLYQLFVNSPYFRANPLLKPESSKGWEVGGNYSFLDEKGKIGCLYFCNHIKDMITLNNTFTTMINLKSAQTQGIESFIHFKPCLGLSLKLEYTVTKAVDLETNRPLYRRPQHKVNGSIEYHVTDKTTLGSDIAWVSRRFDVDFQTSHIPRYNKSYVLMNARVRYALTPKIDLFGRVENATNTSFENPFGFQNPGTAVYVGIKGRY